MGFRSDDFSTVQMYHFLCCYWNRPEFETLPDNYLWWNFPMKSMISIHTLNCDYQFTFLWKFFTAPWSFSHSNNYTFRWTCFLALNLLTWSHDLQQKLTNDFWVLQLEKEIREMKKGVSTGHIKAKRVTITFYKAKMKRWNGMLHIHRIRVFALRDKSLCIWYFAVDLMCLFFFFLHLIFHNLKWKSVKWPHSTSWKSALSKSIYLTITEQNIAG